LRAAKAWSTARWGEALTVQYFKDLDAGARHVAAHQSTTPVRTALSGDSGLGVYLVREHYLIYTPVSDQCIAIVAVLHRKRDVPTLLRKYAYLIHRELATLHPNEA
jgi:plasmid stabilization system protein ParE